MCPPEEMRFRQEQKALVIFEKVRGTENDALPYTTEQLAVKEFKKIGTLSASHWFCFVLFLFCSVSFLFLFLFFLVFSGFFCFFFFWFFFVI
jgi:hypothetical protein